MTAPATIARRDADNLLPSAQLLSIRLKPLWRATTKQPLSVLSVFAYLFFEYVRPQTIYPAINFLPWAQIALLTAAGSMFVQATSVRKWTLVDTGMVIFSLILFASSAFATNSAVSFHFIDMFLSWVLVYAFVSTNINSLPRVVLMLLGWFLWNLKMTIHAFKSWAEIGFGFRNWGVTGAPGWFQNSGEFGIQTTVILPISLYFALAVRPYVSRTTFLALLVLPTTALTGAIASSSRGALLGMAVLGTWMLARSRYKVRGLVGLGVVLALVWVVLPPEQKQRFSTAGEDDTSTTRLTYWTNGIKLANEHPVLGIGYKNWMVVYTDRFGGMLEAGRRVELPHNIFIEALAELGYLGLGALLFLIVANFRLNAMTRRTARRLGENGRLPGHLAWGFDGALIGFMVSGSFVTVLYYPYLWINLAMSVALHRSTARAARFYEGRVQQAEAVRQSASPVSAGTTAGVAV